MTTNDFLVQIDADSIAVITWDTPGRSMNLITSSAIEELENIVERMKQDPHLKGCVIVSGKEHFSAGADLTMIEELSSRAASLDVRGGGASEMRDLYNASRRLSVLYRKIETCGKPFVAAINGLCLGGAFELALSCHYRILSDSQETRVGLPEIKVGLFPGAGGAQRVARLMPTADALQFLFKGEQVRPEAARKLGLVHSIAPKSEIVSAAKAWIKSGGSAVAPWDRADYRLPSGRVYSPAGMMVWPAANAIYRRETFDNYPAAKAILQVVYEGLQLQMDLALRVESRWFAKILRSREARSMIRTLFISTGEINRGARRPKQIPPAKITKLGVIGAGFMGAGIAYVSAAAGLSVVLLDKDPQVAEFGKQQSYKLVSNQIAKGRSTSADRDALLSRIDVGTDYKALSDCDLVIEAVFEDRSVKSETLGRASASINEQAILSSNTSTLPIGSLAKYVARPESFIGIHFFSPVERMPLVELIVGRETSDRAIAIAHDFVRQIKKTPIVVNDGRGFFANRCVGAYILEGHLMLTEGIPPALIENCGRMAGMPVGPLTLNDEIGIDLVWRILNAAEQDLGQTAVNLRQKALLDMMVNRFDRFGRKNGKGFYDYSESRKSLWPGLSRVAPIKQRAEDICVDDLRRRFLTIQALEASRTIEEGIVRDAREADVGSILGFGFAPFTGGVLSYIDGMGISEFIIQCSKLEQQYGERFSPNSFLFDLSRTHETFYSRLAAKSITE